MTTDTYTGSVQDLKDTNEVLEDRISELELELAEVNGQWDTLSVEFEEQGDKIHHLTNDYDDIVKELNEATTALAEQVELVKEWEADYKEQGEKIDDLEEQIDGQNQIIGTLMDNTLTNLANM